MREWMQYARGSALLFASMGVGVACSAPSTSDGTSATESVGSQSAAIINGKLDTTHQAVLMPHCGEKYACICTGTLVKKDDALGIGWIVTAAHCFDSGIDKAMRFYLQGDKVATWADKDHAIQIEPATVRYPILDTVKHPDFTGATELPSGTQLNDIAIVRVLGVGPDSPVIPLVSAPDGVEVGAAVTDVGYGSTGAPSDLNDVYGKVGTRGRSDVKVSALTDNFVIVETNDSGGRINVGDSGGPTLMSVGGVEKVIGIHSTTNEFFGKTYSTRVANKLSWVDGELAKAPKVDTCGLCIQNETGGVRSCAATYRTCLDDADCNVYAHCMEDCGKENGQGPTKACKDTCGTDKPNAIALYDAAVACACQTCGATCGDTCPAGSGSSNPDASTPSGPSTGGDADGSPSGGDGTGDGTNLDSPSSSDGGGCSAAHGSGATTFPAGIALVAAVAALAGRRRRTTAAS